MALELAQDTTQDPYGQPIKKKATVATTAPTSPTAPTGTNTAPVSTGSLSLASSTSGDGNYLGKTITPNQNVNRLQLATDSFNTIAKAGEPFYQKALRDAGSAAAAKGQAFSGQYRTSLGDATRQRNLELDTARDTLTQKATEGSIGDKYADVAIAQQQQGQQATAQRDAYAQALAESQHNLSAELGRSSADVAKGQLKLAERSEDNSTALNAGALTGTYGGAETLASKAQRSGQAIDQGRLELDTRTAARGLDISEATSKGQLELDSRRLSQDEVNAEKARQIENRRIAMQELGMGQDEAFRWAAMQEQRYQAEQQRNIQNRGLALDELKAGWEEGRGQRGLTIAEQQAKADQRLAENEWILKALNTIGALGGGSGVDYSTLAPEGYAWNAQTKQYVKKGTPAERTGNGTVDDPDRGGNGNGANDQDKAYAEALAKWIAGGKNGPMPQRRSGGATTNAVPIDEEPDGVPSVGGQADTPPLELDNTGPFDFANAERDADGQLPNPYGQPNFGASEYGDAEAFAIAQQVWQVQQSVQKGEMSQAQADQYLKSITGGQFGGADENAGASIGLDADGQRTYTGPTAQQQAMTNKFYDRVRQLLGAS